MDGFSGPPSGPAAQYGGGSFGGGYDAEPSQQIMVRNVCSHIPDLISQPLTGDFSYRGQPPTKILSSSSKPLVRSSSLRFCSRALAPREWVSFNFPISLRQRLQSVSACVPSRSPISTFPPHSQIPKLYVRRKTVGYVRSPAISPLFGADLHDVLQMLDSTTAGTPSPRPLPRVVRVCFQTKAYDLELV